MNKQITLLLLIIATLLCFSKAGQVGDTTFYANMTLTNDNWGVTASFVLDYWYRNTGSDHFIRVDYYQDRSQAKILSEFYDYNAGTLYQICNGCNATRLTQAQPLMYVPNSGASNIVSTASCPNPGNYARDDCTTGCTQYQDTNAPSVYGIEFLQYSSNGDLCRAAEVAKSQQGRRVFHVNQYFTSGYPLANPGSDNTYTSVISGVTCPQPQCNVNIDVVFMIDDSGSISNSEYTQQVDFLQNFITRITSPGSNAKVSLVWFSGLSTFTCDENEDTSINRLYAPDFGSSNCQSSSTPACTQADITGLQVTQTTSCDIFNESGGECTNDAGNGGANQNEYCGGYTDITQLAFKDGAVQSANVNVHARASSYTCITCGMVAAELAFTDSSYNARNIANLTRAAILLTDGVQNRQTKYYNEATNVHHTDYLQHMGNQLKNQGITVFSVGVSGASQTELEKAAGGVTENVFSVDTFDYSLIEEQLFQRVCETSFPSLSPCSNPCLCACGQCEPPNCDDGNKCFVAGTSADGTCLDPVAVTCDPQDACKVPSCNNATGCVYNDLPRPAYVDSNKCWTYSCSNGQWIDDNGAKGQSECPNNLSNLCLIRYCNSSDASGAGACATIDTRDFDYNTKIVFVDGTNTTIDTYRGCKRPTTAIPCETYTCQADGTCTYDDSSCVCKTDTDCTQTNGCQQYTCNTAANACQLSSTTDCYNVLSAGGCTVNGALSSTPNQPSLDLLYGNYSGDMSIFNTVSGTNNPTVGPTRSCDDLACFNGEPSTYQCVPVQGSTTAFTCARTRSQCSPDGCKDNICVRGNWNSGTLQSSCQDVFVPDCTNPSVCFTGQCNATAPPSPLSGRCFNVPALTCDDGNPCTQNICDDVSGCQYPWLVSSGPMNNTCTNYNCIGGVFVDTDVGVGACAASLNPTNDKCIVTYCNEGAGNSCASFNKSANTNDVTETYTDSRGVTHTFNYCGKPATETSLCKEYLCNSATGECVVDTSSCACTMDSECDDGNSCTTEFCNTSGNCETTAVVDCYNVVSNGQCNVNTTFTGSTTTGANVLFNTGSYPANQWDISATNVDRTCDQMACFNGQRSTFRCNGAGAQPVCERVAQPCSPNGCVNNVCRSLGTFTNGQIDSDCFDLAPPDCMPETNKCFRIECNASAPIIDNMNTGRCVTTTQKTLENINDCDDNNPCTDDSCVPATGCVNTWKSAPTGLTNDTCSLYQCDNGLFPRIDTGVANCAYSGSDKCFIRYCDTTTGVCASVNTSELAFGTSGSITDSAGNIINYQGCQRPASALPCETYTCQDDNTCVFDDSNCVCKTDTDCNKDMNGCTLDVCNTALNRCENTTIDCYAELSEGNCPVNFGGLSESNALGQQFFLGTAPNNNIVRQPDANGNPQDGIARSCEELACFNGEPSSYRCLSTSPTSYRCQRTVVEPCTTTGCTISFCKNFNNWLTASDRTRQIRVGCELLDYTCLDPDSCSFATCNATYDFSDPIALRCIAAQKTISQLCDDGDRCTQDLCDPTDTSPCVELSNGLQDCAFCRNIPYNETYLKTNLCMEAQTCQTTTCVNNRCRYTDVQCQTGDACFNFICNSTDNTCKKVALPNTFVDVCGICLGNNKTCFVNTPGIDKKKSAIVAAVVGSVVAGLFALCAAIFGLKKGYDKYNELANEGTGAVKPNPGYEAKPGGQNPGVRESGVIN